MSSRTISTPRPPSPACTVFSPGRTTPGTQAKALASARILGLLQAPPSAWQARREASAGIDPTTVERLIEARLTARRAKAWAESDRIRGRTYCDGRRAQGRQGRYHELGCGPEGSVVMPANDNKPALRPMLPADAPMLAAIFRASIEDLTGEDYDEEQRTAWADTAADEAAFGERLGGILTLVATMAGAPAAFASLKGNDRIAMLYVYPAVTGAGHRHPADRCLGETRTGTRCQDPVGRCQRHGPRLLREARL